MIAQAVFKLANIHSEYVRLGKIEWPEFCKEDFLIARNNNNDQMPDILIQLCQSLVECKVEYCNGVCNFIDRAKFPIEISPAIAIVLFYLLGIGSGLKGSWNNSGFLAALNKVAHLVVNNKPGVKPQLVKLSKPLLLTNWGCKVTLFLPLLDKFSVAMNGKMALYADVIAPFRLVQCKYKQDHDSGVDLFLVNEMTKMD